MEGEVAAAAVTVEVTPANRDRWEGEVMRHWNTFAAHMLLILVAGGLTVPTLGLPVVVPADPASLASVRLGWPVWFLVQDQSRYTPPGEFWRTGLVSPWECPTWRMRATG